MKIKCLLVMPGKEVQKTRIPASNKFIKSFIGTDLLKIKLNDNNLIIANQNAESDEFNRIFQECILFGTFFIVSIKKGNLKSMKKRDIRKFYNMFKLSKHQNKIARYKDEFLEEYYYRQKEIKEENKKRNKEIIFGNAA